MKNLIRSSHLLVKYHKNYLSIFLLLFFLLPSTIIAAGTLTIYEDAEDDSIQRWVIHDNDPAGATIENVYNNDLGSRVIKFTGTGTMNSFQSEGWLDAVNTIFAWKMQTSATFRVMVQIHTNNGTKYLIYTNYSNPNGEISSDGRYIWYGLGSNSIDGTWQSYARDIRFDLQRFQPTNDLIDIGWFRFNGSGSFDDIMTYQEDTVPPTITILGDNPMNINLGDTFIDPGVLVKDNTDSSPNLEIDSSVNTDINGIFFVKYTAIDANGNSATALRRVDVIDSNSSEIVYEDAEDANTIGWTIYDNDPLGATISNVYDDEWGSRVIAFDGNGTENSYRLRYESLYGTFSRLEDRTHTNVSWSMKYAEPFEIDIRTTTLLGARHLLYKNVNSNEFEVSDEGIKYGLGENAADNTWQSFERDIVFDLKNAELENELISIDQFTIRGSGRIDNIIASGSHGYTLLNRIGYIKRSPEDALVLGDLEAIRYIASENQFAIVDDDNHLLYELDPITGKVTQIIHDSIFGAYTQENPNGYEPINLRCVYDPVTSNMIGFCDPEAIAYDQINDAVYIFTGNHPGELMTFKFTRSAPDQNFTISDWKRVDYEYTSAIVIDGQLYVSQNFNLWKADWESGLIYGEAIFTAGSEIEEIAYSNGILWILMDTAMLYKVDFSTKTILDSYDLFAYDIRDPRGVEVIDNKLYIGDGDDARTDDLKHAIHIFDLP